MPGAGQSNGGVLYHPETPPVNRTRRFTRENLHRKAISLK